MQPIEPRRTAHRWLVCCLPLPVCATHHLLRHYAAQGPWSLSPQPAPARPPPTLPTSEAPRSRTVCCKPRNVPRSAQRDVGGQREAGDPVERQSRAKSGPRGSIGSVDTHSPRHRKQGCCETLRKTRKWSREGLLSVHKDGTGGRDLNPSL